MMIDRYQIDEVADMIIRHYVEISGSMPSFKDYVRARKCALRELSIGVYSSSVNEDNHSTEIVQPAVKMTPSLSVKHTEKKSSVRKQAVGTVKESSPVREEVSVSAEITQPKQTDKAVVKEEKKKSDFDILRNLEDEWN